MGYTSSACFQAPLKTTKTQGLYLECAYGTIQEVDHATLYPWDEKKFSKYTQRFCQFNENTVENVCGVALKPVIGKKVNNKCIGKKNCTILHNFNEKVDVYDMPSECKEADAVLSV